MNYHQIQVGHYQKLTAKLLHKRHNLTLLTVEQVEKLIARVHECVEMAEEYYGYEVDFVKPQIEFTKGGGNFGSYNGSTNVLKINEDRAAHDFKDAMEDTIPHEVAHFVDYQYHGGWETGVYRSGKKAGKRYIKGHGKRWQSIMRNIYGLEPKRTGTSGAPVVRRKQQRWGVVLPCGCRFSVSTTIKNKIQRGQRRVCVKHRQRICPSSKFYQLP